MSTIELAQVLVRVDETGGQAARERAGVFPEGRFDLGLALFEQVEKLLYACTRVGSYDRMHIVIYPLNTNPDPLIRLVCRQSPHYTPIITLVQE